MKLRITYRARYEYEQPVSLSLHTVRIFPKKDLKLQYSSFSFRAPEGVDVQYRKDIFDNEVAILFFPELMREMVLEMDLIVDTEVKNPFHFLLDSRGLGIPPDYTAEERKILAGYLESVSDFGLPDPLISEERRPTVEALVTMNRWMNTEIEYERREEGGPRLPEETLRLRKGSCRDIALLMAEVLRRNGVAARLVSGFLWERTNVEQERVALGAMHAWVEAYLPGAGWIGLDPTNGVLSDHHCLPCAVGIRPEDVTPVLGSYYSKNRVASKLGVEVQVQEVG